MELDGNGQGKRGQEKGYGRRRHFNGKGCTGEGERSVRDRGGEAPGVSRAADSGGKERFRGSPLSEEESVRLFVNIGRSRRLFPREILGLILSSARVSREDIGAIRILDNYSFVQVRNSVAEDIIAALHGKTFRGRALVVNYARTKKEDFDAGEDEAGDAARAGEDPFDSAESGEPLSGGPEDAPDRIMEDGFASEPEYGPEDEKTEADI
jgi:hypothetical protein